MRILFLHPNFPSQFHKLAAALAATKGNEVVFGTMAEHGTIPGVRKILYKPAPRREGGHHYLVSSELPILQGQAAYRMGIALKKEGFIPDIIFAHSGFGPSLFMKDVFPRSVLACNFEWFYRSTGADLDFGVARKLTIDNQAEVRMKNASILTELAACDGGTSAMGWQRQQFPKEFHSKIEVCHEGVPTEFFSPDPSARLVLPQIGLDLSGVKEIVTYSAPGMEPHRGFPEFIEAAHYLMEARPNCHVVIVGADQVNYGNPLPNGQTFKKVMLEKFPLDPERTHFTGLLPYPDYRKVLQCSSVHAYLTRPYILSWSMLEAMSCGCVVVGSKTGAVTEVIQDGVNGHLADLVHPREITDKLAEVLDGGPKGTARVRKKARETILEKYELKKCLTRQVNWLGRLLG